MAKEWKMDVEFMDEIFNKRNDKWAKLKMDG